MKIIASKLNSPLYIYILILILSNLVTTKFTGKNKKRESFVGRRDLWLQGVRKINLQHKTANLCSKETDGLA